MCLTSQKIAGSTFINHSYFADGWLANCEVRGTSVKWYILSLFFESVLQLLASRTQRRPVVLNTYSMSPQTIPITWYILILKCVCRRECECAAVGGWVWLFVFSMFECTCIFAYLPVCGWVGVLRVCVFLRMHVFCPLTDIFIQAAISTVRSVSLTGFRQGQKKLRIESFSGNSVHPLCLRQQQVFHISCWSCSHLSGENVSIQSCIA